MGVIYHIVNVATDEFYVGSTTNSARRKWQHWDDLKKGHHHCSRLQKAWDCFGEHAFQFVVVAEVLDSELRNAENEALAKHVGAPHCYNLLEYVGQPPAEHPQVRQKIRQIMTKKYSDDPLCHPRLGKKHSEEVRKKISEKVQAAVARGGAGKYTRSEETLTKLSAAQKGNQNALGVKRSAEECEAIRQRFLGNTNWLGKKHSEESRIKMGKRVELVLPDGTVKEYPTITILRAEWGMTSVAANRALKAGAPITKGKFEGMVLRYAGSGQTHPPV